MKLNINGLLNFFCFTKDATLEEQEHKIKEEEKEFWAEVYYGTSVGDLIAEGLDCITARLNFLMMHGMTQKHIDQHVTKLTKYKETRYGKKKEGKIDRIEVLKTLDERMMLDYFEEKGFPIPIMKNSLLVWAHHARLEEQSERITEAEKQESRDWLLKYEYLI